MPIRIRALGLARLSPGSLLVLSGDLLLLSDQLVLDRSQEELVGILLRVNLQQRGSVDLAQQSV